MGSFPPAPVSSSGVPRWAHLVGHPAALRRLHQNGMREAPSRCWAEAQEHGTTLTSAEACTGPSPRPQVHGAVGGPPGVPARFWAAPLPPGAGPVTYHPQGGLSASQPGLPAFYVLPAAGRKVCCKALPSATTQPHRPLQPHRFPITTPQSPLSGGPKRNVSGIQEFRCAVPAFVWGSR
ncbi:hypothetical protein NDU88_001996 [Pleurodeles waltl]|uniref:Uncharacterized protein n=1 Tax=Pleurodeles waltl TaxID=8319 RepID=A0AAV7NF15_PLEWA|nr:hypothetical protein NDU88_001996 [Pleurodeles waltl]